MPKRKPAMIPGHLSENLTEDGRRRIQLTNDQRAMYQRQQLIEGAVAMYLDVTQRRTKKQIADELGITIHQLKNLEATEEFERVYNENIADLGHDPRLRATKHALMDLLSPAVEALTDVLESGTSGAKVTAAKMVLGLNGIVGQSMADSDKKQLIDFLREQGNVTINNINLPSEYQEAMQGYEQAVDGEFREVSDIGTGDSDEA